MVPTVITDHTREQGKLHNQKPSYEKPECGNITSYNRKRQKRKRYL